EAPLLDGDRAARARPPARTRRRAAARRQELLRRAHRHRPPPRRAHHRRPRARADDAGVPARDPGPSRLRRAAARAAARVPRGGRPRQVRRLRARPRRHRRQRRARARVHPPLRAAARGAGARGGARVTLHGWRLADPLWLGVLLVAAAALALAARRRGRATLLYSSVALLRGAPVTLAQRARRLLPWLRFAALALVTVGLARPQQGMEEFRVRTEGIAIVMAIDQSGSMQALDFQVDGKRRNRLEVVKRVFREFVEGKGALQGRPDDKIGLVSFGGFASDRCPLTLDHGALLQVL